MALIKIKPFCTFWDEKNVYHAAGEVCEISQAFYEKLVGMCEKYELTKPEVITPVEENSDAAKTPATKGGKQPEAKPAKDAAPVEEGL